MRVLNLALWLVFSTVALAQPVVVPDLWEPDVSGEWSGGAWGDIELRAEDGSYAFTIERPGHAPRIARQGTIRFTRTGAHSFSGYWKEAKRGGVLMFSVTARDRGDRSTYEIRGRYWSDPRGGRLREANAFVWRAVVDTPQPVARPKVRIRVLDDRKAFSAQLRATREVGFDDIPTQAGAPETFHPERYEKTHGVIIEGTRGQFVDRHFDYPGQFVATSAPNMYAPGPKAGDPALPTGGNETTVRFTVRDRAAVTAGFGCMFHDVDNPRVAPTSLVAFDATGQVLGSVSGFSTKNGGSTFRGLVALNEDDVPLPVIHRVLIINGDGWPARHDGEGVALDDFTFAIPVVPN